MTRRIIFIILGALIFFGLLLLLWMLLFNRPKTTPGTTGGFSSASNRASGASGTGSGAQTNVNIPLGSQGGAGGGSGAAGGGSTINGGTIALGTQTGGARTGGVGGISKTSNIFIPGLGTGGTFGGASGAGGQGGAGSVPNPPSPPGVQWLGGGTNGNFFNPSTVNGITGDAGGFVPTIQSAVNPNGASISLITALAGTAIAGSLTCAIQAGYVTLQAPQATAAATAATAAGVVTSAAADQAATALGTLPVILPLIGPSPPGPSIPGALVAGTGPLVVEDLGLRFHATASYPLQITQTALQASQTSVQALQLAQQTVNSTESKADKFRNCLVNVIAKTALQQLTISVVNWINGGFSGQPSFVTNFQKFFTDVADNAAGAFIKSDSNFAFLCSPFKLQIKIAIAQSYARRNAQSCSLSKVIKNFNNFMSNFSQGGWAGLLSFTTIPTNNPYGAYAYAQVGLLSAQNQAAQNAQRNISPTGFLNLQKLSGCKNPTDNGIAPGYGIGINPQAAQASNVLPDGCKAKVVTPGSAIAESLGAVNKSGIDQLGVGNSIDQIISALTTQLTTKILYNGLSSLSAPASTQTAADLAAQAQAASILTDIQNRIQVAQQLGVIYQGSIGDLQQAQSQLNTLANCWSAATSTANAAAAQAQMQMLELQVDAYNNSITQVNSSIAQLNQFETQVSTAASIADVATLAANYQAALAQNAFPSAADVTVATQNRTTLQAQMAAQNQDTAIKQNQCNALPH